VEHTHPHAEATYRVTPFGDGAFAVEVNIPESYPAKVSPFATKADAEAWIAEHRRRVQSGAAGFASPVPAEFLAVGCDPPPASQNLPEDATIRKKVFPEPLSRRGFETAVCLRRTRCEFSGGP
jgi:hypothetical protein